jgi:hypothetical protein
MSNAPERIWIEGAVSNEVWKHDKQSCLIPHEYIRADRIAAMIDEAAQAEREACAETVESLWAYRTCSEVAAAIRARKGGEA